MFTFNNSVFLLSDEKAITMRLLSELESTKANDIAVQKENAFLKERLKSHYRDLNDIPFPIGEKLKDGNGRFIFIGFNKSFKNINLFPLDKNEAYFFGKTNEEIGILSEEVYSVINYIDSLVAETGRPFIKLNKGIGPDGKYFNVATVRWSTIRRNNDTIITFMDIPMDSIKKKNK